MNKYPGVLGRHFEEDFGFSNDNPVLHIIDQYHIKSIKRGQADFYLEAFNDVHTLGLTTIVFYFPISKLDFQDYGNINMIIKNQPEEDHFSQKQIEILYSCLNVKGDKNKETFFNSEVLRFVDLMYTENNINVIFKPYNKSAISIHGRYWVTKTGGILVDGSLSTGGIVLAQKLDNGVGSDGVYRDEDDNYKIVMREMFNKINDNLDSTFKDGIKKETVSKFYSICNTLHLVK